MSEKRRRTTQRYAPPFGVEVLPRHSALRCGRPRRQGRRTMPTLSSSIRRPVRSFRDGDQMADPGFHCVGKGRDARGCGATRRSTMSKASLCQNTIAFVSSRISSSVTAGPPSMLKSGGSVAVLLVNFYLFPRRQAAALLHGSLPLWAIEQLGGAQHRGLGPRRRAHCAARPARSWFMNSGGVSAAEPSASCR